MTAQTSPLGFRSARCARRLRAVGWDLMRSIPEGRVGAWRWMLRGSDARRSTLRELGVGVGRNTAGGVLSWDAHGDLWTRGFRFEVQRPLPSSPVPPRGRT